MFYVQKTSYLPLDADTVIADGYKSVVYMVICTSGFCWNEDLEQATPFDAMIDAWGAANSFRALSRDVLSELKIIGAAEW